MLIELDYSGHYPRKVVEITKEEHQKIRSIEASGYYLFDTEEGRELIKSLEDRPSMGKKVPVIVVYQ